MLTMPRAAVRRGTGSSVWELLSRWTRQNMPSSRVAAGTGATLSEQPERLVRFLAAAHRILLVVVVRRQRTDAGHVQYAANFGTRVHNFQRSGVADEVRVASHQPVSYSHLR